MLDDYKIRIRASLYAKKDIVEWCKVREVLHMTIRQQAYVLIDRLPEDSVQAVIEVMLRMLPVMNKRTEQVKPPVNGKMQAFLRLQAIRKEMAQYHIDVDERAAAMDEKYGEFLLGGGKASRRNKA